MKRMSMVMASGVILAIIIGIVGVAFAADDVLYPPSMKPTVTLNTSDVKSTQPTVTLNTSEVKSTQPTVTLNTSQVTSSQPTVTLIDLTPN